MTKRLRIFISSPGDVQEERLRAHLVIQKLARDYRRFFQIEAYLWEHEPMLASGHFQDAIEAPSASDVVLLIVYSRLGTALPERSATREYRGLDGRAPVTGTEWEFEEALEAHRSRGAPDLLAYRKVGDPGASLTDAARRTEQERQWQALEAFWHRHFETSTIFLAGSAKFKTLEEFDQKLESDLTALIERRIAQDSGAAVQSAEPVWLRGSPFRGLASYDFADAPIFFGRDAQIRAALTRLQAAAERGTAFLLLLGGSGSGKSSLARAGLLPALLAPMAVPGVGAWRRVILRPAEGEQDPVLGLVRALIQTDAEGLGLPELVSSPDEAGRLANHLAASADDPSYPFRQALDRVISDERSRNKGLLPHETARLVLLVDQMEELFTRRVDPARRDLFVRILAGLARSGCVWVFATMRNDLWHRAVEVPQLIELVEAGARFDLLPPDGAQIIEIIRRSASAAGLTFETSSDSGIGLDAVIAEAAVGEPGALPLLSVMLESLYERDIAAFSGESRRQLRFATYHELGELKGAIARRADDVIDRIAAADPEAAAAFPSVLRALVTASGSGTVTSRPARADTFADGSPESRLAASMLAPEARLLVSTNSERGSEIRLAHEALVDNWPRARDQIALDRRDLETRARLEALLRRWTGAPTAEEKARALLTGLNLAEGSDLVRRWNIDPVSDLAAFVHASEKADQWRRRRLLVAASVVLCIFAGLALVASLQWRRAENEAQTALRAQETEKQARAVAESERSRAVANEERAAEALRATQRETAQTLSAQAQLANAQHDARRALSLAVQAGNIEKDALRPGDRPASETALMQALAGAREVLHVRGASQNWWMPYAFMDDATLAWADAKAGLVLVDLRHDSQVIAHIPLPTDTPVNHMAAAPARNLVLLAIGRELLVVDTSTKQVQSRFAFNDRIASLDVSPRAQRAAVAVGTGVAFVDLTSGEMTAPVAVTDAQDATKVGQVRFSRSADVLFVSYGVKIFRFDLATKAFAGPAGELSGTGMGVDQATLDSVLAKGTVPFVRMFPETPARLFTVAPLELQAIETETKRGTALRTENSEYEFRGIAALDQERKGRTVLTTILTRSRDDKQDLQVRYVSGDDGLILGQDGRLLPPFASLSVPSSDLANQKLDTCQASPNGSYLACQYWSRETQGLLVWRLLGGNHQFEQLAQRYNASSAVLNREAELVVTADTGIVSIATGSETRLADLGEDWRLAEVRGAYLVAVSPAAGQARILKRTSKEAVDASSPPFAAKRVVPVPGKDRALIQEANRITLIDIANGRTMWTAPIGDVLHIGISANGQNAIAVAPNAVYVIETDTGRILKSHPLALAPDAPVVADPAGKTIAFLDAAGKAVILDIDSGTSKTVGDSAAPTQFAWSNEGKLLLIGGKDGSVLAWDAEAGRKWLVPSIFSRAFQATAWPGQPPQGVVLEFALSHDGKRFAVMRQDIPTVDVHDLADGRLLTQLTPPWTTLKVPAHIAFGPEDELVTTWAVHAMARDKPRFVTVHKLPRNFDEALALASARLIALNTTWSPAGPQPASGAGRPDR